MLLNASIFNGFLYQFKQRSTPTNSAAWPVHYACAHHPGSGSHGKLLYSGFGEDETENELHQASFADVYACGQLLFRYTLPQKTVIS